MNGRLWTEREREIVEAMIGEHSTAAIAKALGVSEGRVNNAIARWGLSRKQLNVFSAHELASILGIEGNWIRASMLEAGLLPYKRVAGRGRFGITQVRLEDLIAFLAEYPHLVDRKKVDPAFQQYVAERWITLGEAFRRGAAHVVSLEHAYRAGFLEGARRRGTYIVIPEAMLPELKERRRRHVDDIENRRQYRVYTRAQARRRPIRARQWKEARARAIS